MDVIFKRSDKNGNHMVRGSFTFDEKGNVIIDHTVAHSAVELLKDASAQAAEAVEAKH